MSFIFCFKYKLYFKKLDYKVINIFIENINGALDNPAGGKIQFLMK